MMLTTRYLSIALIAFATTTHAWVGSLRHVRQPSLTLFSQSDSSASGGTAATDDDDLSAEELKKLDYANQVSDLFQLLNDTQEKVARIKALVRYIKLLELEDKNLSKLPAEAASLKTAIAEAKAAKEMYGAGSPEATRAWEDVEQCADDTEACDVGSMYRYSAAALKTHHYYDAVIDVEFLDEAVEALDTIDNLRDFIQIEKTRLKEGGESSEKSEK